MTETFKRRKALGMLGGTGAAALLVGCASDDLAWGPDGPLPAEESAAAAAPGSSSPAAQTTIGASDPIVPVLLEKSGLAKAESDEEHVSYAPAVPPLASRNDQRVWEVHLEVLEGVCPLDPANGVDTLMWGYRVKGDNQIECGTPGPILRGRVGDLARITLTNLDGNEHPHNIDFHAVTGQGGGAADLTVPPGESATIEARLLYPGAFMYHCAYGDVPEHIARGMYGMFIVDPETPLAPVDHEWGVMQSEWYVGEAGADGVAELDREALTNEEPRYVTFNGRTDALTEANALTMMVGERARIYMVNEGLNLDSNFHPIGSQWDTVYPEAATHPVNRVIRGSQSTLVVAGGGTVTELVAYVPSTLILVDHALVRTFYKGAIGHLVIEGEEDPEVFSAGQSAAGTAPAAPAAPAEANQVIITEGAWDVANADVAYSPKSLEVAVGTTVTWVSQDSVLHTVTSGSSNGTSGTPDGLFDSGDMLEGDTFEYTFDDAGTFEYYCVPHPWMVGTVTVS
jgi:nitrite reductase (NO-forming)